MPDAALILRRTLAERQLIRGEGQKPQKNGLNSPAVVANEIGRDAIETLLGQNRNHAPGG